MMIGDWYHRPAYEILEEYRDWRKFKIEPAPDSLLLNGQGYFNCSMATNAKPVDCFSIDAPSVLLTAPRTRVRIINTGSLVGFSVSTKGYKMMLIRIDGGQRVVEATASSIGILYPGERIDVVLERTLLDAKTSAVLKITLDRENMRFPNLALTPIQEFRMVSRNESPMTQPHDSEEITADDHNEAVLDLADIKGALRSPGTLSENADQTVLLYTTISYLTEFEYRPKGFVNRTSWSSGALPDLPLSRLSRAQWPTDPAPLVPLLQNGSWVDIVVNNLDDKGEHADAEWKFRR
jgi:hypothetical protein